MRIFEDIPRGRDQRPRRENESIFDYMNSSSRPLVAGIRELLELWFERYPEDAKHQLKRRLYSRTDSQHQSAFFELYLHELLTSRFEVVLEPDMGLDITTHPDFKASLDGNPRFYLEAVLASQALAEVVKDARIAEVFGQVNRINSPNFMLQVSYHGAPTTAPSTRLLRQKLEHWLLGLEPNEIAGIDLQTEYHRLPCLEWCHEDWQVEFRPIPIAPEFRGLGITPVVGAVMPSTGAEVIDLESYVDKTHVAVRSAIRRKATKYKVLGLPYIVAVNILEPFADERNLLDALFGEEQITVSLSPSAGSVTTHRRAADGAWIGPDGPHNTRVSAVLACFNLTPLVSATRAPILVHNPWASNPLPMDLWPLSQISVHGETGTLDRIDDRSPAELLRFPFSWPPPKD